MRPRLPLIFPLIVLGGLAACTSVQQVWANFANPKADADQDLMSCRLDSQKQVGPDLFTPPGDSSQPNGFWSSDHSSALDHYNDLVNSCMTAKGYKLVPDQAS